MQKKIILGMLTATLWASNVQANYHCDQIIKKSGFEVCYNFQLKEPLWSKATLTAHDLRKKGYSRKGIRFYEERSVPKISNKQYQIIKYHNKRALFTDVAYLRYSDFNPFIMQGVSGRSDTSSDKNLKCHPFEGDD